MKDIIQKKLDRYNPKSSEEELNALKEITQEVALYSLYKAGFFQRVSFLGGTSLRILHNLDRFSEDLDFSTRSPEPNFNIITYLEKAMEFMNTYGYNLSINQKISIDQNVRGRFLKDDSIKKTVLFKYQQDTRKKVKVKIEVDINPPIGANEQIKYLSFPVDFPIPVYDLPSLMSGKLHAILCRPFCKGRDWYDLLWYISQGVEPNLPFFKNALSQWGPWKNKSLSITPHFIQKELLKKVHLIKWNELVMDVRKFLTQEKKESLDIWGRHFFESKIKDIKFSKTHKRTKSLMLFH